MAEAAKADPRLRSNWGTIVKPPFELGYQKVENAAEISERLHTTEIKVRRMEFQLNVLRKGLAFVFIVQITLM